MRWFQILPNRWDNKPLHEAIIEALHANEIAGVTVYKGIVGYGVHRELHEQKTLAHNAPLMLSVIDTDDHILGFMPILEKMVKEGMAVLSDVDIITYRFSSNSLVGGKEGG